MATETTYTFSASADTATGVVDAGTIKNQIVNKKGLVTAPASVSVSGDVITVVMKDDLTPNKSWQGPYNVATTYAVDEMVVKGGIAYLNISESTGDTPPNATYWTARADTTEIGKLCEVIKDHEGPDLAVEPPHAPDGRHYMIPSVLPKGLIPIYQGFADDVTNGTLWGGSLLKHSASTDDDHVLEYQMIQPEALVGGFLKYEGAKIGDYIILEINAPATAGTLNTGSGWYNQTAGKWTYAPNQDGNYDLNLTETLNANVDFTKAVPVPSPTQTGWFNYNQCTDDLTINTDQEGNYDLYYAIIPVIKYIKIGLLGKVDSSIPFTIPAIASKTILPHWKHKVTVHQTTTNQLDMIWWYVAGKSQTC